MNRRGRWMLAVLMIVATTSFADHGARAAVPPMLAPVAMAPPAAKAAATPAAREATILASPGAEAEKDYGQREARHPRTADFRGGDSVGIYIGGSAGLLILVLLVIILLR